LGQRTGSVLLKAKATGLPKDSVANVSLIVALDKVLAGIHLEKRWYARAVSIRSANTAAVEAEFGEDSRFDELRLLGYTSAMKTAISIPDDVFEEAERLVDRLQTSRSQLYTRALAEFVARHADDRVEAAMNGVVAEVGPGVDEFTREAARRTLRRVE
jgi:predicted transcriptional regulator